LGKKASEKLSNAENPFVYGNISKTINHYRTNTCVISWKTGKLGTVFADISMSVEKTDGWFQ
jgi:hypothetical protein